MNEETIRILEQIKEALGDRPTMPDVNEDLQEQMQWRHGACFMWDKWMKIIDSKIEELR